MDLRLDITGTEPLLMHNSRLADPLDPMAKALKGVTGKTKKTDDDHLEMAKLEFLGGLYFDDVAGPYIPGDNISRMLVDAGRKRKLGTKVTAGCFVTSSINPLAYGHGEPRTPMELWDSGRFSHRASAKVGMQRVNRTRPHFPVWTTSATIYLDTEVLDESDLRTLVDIGGRLVGLGDWRPRFGRFTGTLTVLKGVS
jgi:hypothetical protein